MPPRLPVPTQALQTELASLASSSSITHTASPLERALLSCQTSTFPHASRSFSTTASRGDTTPLPRQKFFEWKKLRGAKLQHHQPGQTNYLSGFNKKTPFPSNPAFKSQPVLSEDARESIYKRVHDYLEPIKYVSADLGVDHRRVAAVVRMKAVEKEWERTGKKLAKPYSQAIMEMVPTHSYAEDMPKRPLEPINEIHVHGYTMQQLFVPTSESRHFTREDAADAFHHTMLSADARMPHKEFVEHHRRVKDGMRERDSQEQFVEAARKSQAADETRYQRRKDVDKRITTTIPSERFDFRIKKMQVDDVGRGGRARRGVGWRYGAPFEDRKKNQVKIPTKYE